tara:strand:+ start:520 stop:828 length:309 start_codon:yes stop_codon:yes gene_type:complete
MPRENVRFKATPQGRVQFTEAEEVARDAEEKEWTDGANDRAAAANRNTRNKLLTESDWTQMPDSALTDEAKALWVTHRTALRDLTAHEDWPNLADADWPTAP